MPATERTDNSMRMYSIEVDSTVDYWRKKLEWRSQLEMVSRWNSTFKPFQHAHFSILLPRVFDAYVIRWKNARRMMAKCSRAGFWVMPLFHHTSGLFPSCTCAVQNFCCHRCSSREIAHGKMALMENLLTLWHADGIPSRMQSSQFPF